jgi:GAF domain-containing protein
VAAERREQILAALAAEQAMRSSVRLCQVSMDIVGVTGAGIMLMSGDLPGGSVCTTDQVSALIEDLQYTLGEGPCVDAYRHDRVVLEPDLAAPATARWSAFTPVALRAGVRAVFGFPLRVGAVRLGAVNLYQDQPGGLSVEQHADALVIAEVVAGLVLDLQANAPEGSLAQEFELGADFHYLLQNAAGIVSVQLGVNVAEALIRLRAYAFSHDQLIDDVARDVVAHRLRLE